MVKVILCLNVYISLNKINYFNLVVKVLNQFKIRFVLDFFFFCFDVTLILILPHISCYLNFHFLFKQI